jgi:hypothetical protein
MLADPPLAGEGEDASSLILAARFLRPSFAKPLHETFASKK